MFLQGVTGLKIGGRRSECAAWAGVRGGPDTSSGNRQASCWGPGAWTVVSFSRDECDLQTQKELPMAGTVEADPQGLDHRRLGMK